MADSEKVSAGAGGRLAGTWAQGQVPELAGQEDKSDGAQGSQHQQSAAAGAQGWPAPPMECVWRTHIWLKSRCSVEETH